ncbi:hypothetical protein phiK7B1_113 [Pseudomonas phage phiK7B1]|nr:hypothetical protein phiK7B1_113 [Pseudomonas phage phiK7B1]
MARKRKIVSIQVQTTRLTGGGAETVPYLDGKATHWSVYVRYKNGEVQWLADTPVDRCSSEGRRTALVFAAELSMEHGVPIEKIY